MDLLIDSGETVKTYPFIAKLKVMDLGDQIPFKIVITAPKRSFKLAHDRNRIKRICREAIRLNKSKLESYLMSQHKQLALFLFYTPKEELNQEQLQKSTVKLFNNIIKKLEENEN